MREDTVIEPREEADAGMPAFPEALRPGMEVNGFRLVRYVNKGGYGCVWLAENLHRPGQLCALKFNLHPPAEDPTADARALREVPLLLRAAHPNVVGVLGYGRWLDVKTGIVYIVLEWVEGATLLDWALQSNPSFRQLVRLVQKLVRALQAAHAQGVLHRDVKPENVLVREVDGEPFLADFGMGETEHSTPLTWGGFPPGTRHYLSPEALAFSQRTGGRPYHFRPADDWYALGVTLYEVLTEVLPFPDGQGGAVYEEEALRRQPVPPHVLNRRVPPELSKVVMRLLARHPRRRYRDGQQLEDALDAALARPGSWDEPMYEPAPPRVPGRTPTQKPTPGDGPAAEDDEVAWRHALKHEDSPREQRRAAVVSLRDALLPGQPRVWPAAVRRAGVGLVLVLAALGAWVGGPSLKAALSATRMPPPLPLARSPEPALAPVSGLPQPPLLPPGAGAMPGFVAVPPSQPSMAAAAATAQKEDGPVKTPQSSPPDHPSSSATPKRTSGGSKLALMCAGALTTGCSGVPLRPVAQECPPAAIQNMRARGFKIDLGVPVRLDAAKPRPHWGDDPLKLVAGQKVISDVYGEFPDDPEAQFAKDRRIPVGTLLYGKVIAAGEGYFFIRYDAALFPGDSQKSPICALAESDLGSGRLIMGAGSTSTEFTHKNRVWVTFKLAFPGGL